MSLESLTSFIGSLTQPLVLWITEKLADRFGGKKSTLRQVAIQSLAFVLLLIPVTLLFISLIGMVIFSFQMMRAAF